MDIVSLLSVERPKRTRLEERIDDLSNRPQVLHCAGDAQPALSEDRIASEPEIDMIGQK